MLARRIVAKHVTGTTALAMLGATAVLAVYRYYLLTWVNWVH